PGGHAEQMVRTGRHGEVARQAAVEPCIRERSRQQPPHPIEVPPHTPRRRGIDRTTLERRVAHEASPLTPRAANQPEHPTEEGPDLTPRCPRVLERLEHRIHDRLRVTLQAGEVQVAFAAEGRIQAVPAGAGAADQPVEPGRGIALPPEQLHGTVEGFSWVERLGPWHARPNSRTRSLI